jgi:hypothetical protein
MIDTKLASLHNIQVDEYYEDISCSQEKIEEKLQSNPYPGLRPFKTSESMVFFGRESLSFELLSLLAEKRFVSIIGSSGSGKSSLVRAGLVPLLGSSPGKLEWNTVICRPGSNPFGNLAGALYHSLNMPFKVSYEEIYSTLTSSSYGLENYLRQKEVPNTFNTLIIIDQFEEIFRFRQEETVGSRNHSALFIKSLIDACKKEDLNVFVVITMRSEYLNDCIQFSDLTEAINGGQYLVPKLTNPQIKRAISEPALYAGAEMADVFAEELSNEIGENMDQLPILQHALHRSYTIAKKRAGTKTVEVDFNDYVAAGKMSHALDAHANEIYNELTPAQKDYCRILFKSITDKATDGRGIRRPLPYSTILNICIEYEAHASRDKELVREDLNTVVDKYRDSNASFLMPPPHVKLNENTEIDISHESLMRVWSKLTNPQKNVPAPEADEALQQPNLHFVARLQRMILGYVPQRENRRLTSEADWTAEEANDANMLRELMSRGRGDYLPLRKIGQYDAWRNNKRPGVTWAALYKPSYANTGDFPKIFGEAMRLIDKSIKKRRKDRILAISAAACLFTAILIIIVQVATFKAIAQKTAAIADKQRAVLEATKIQAIAARQKAEFEAKNIQETAARQKAELEAKTAVAFAAIEKAELEAKKLKLEAAAKDAKFENTLLLQKVNELERAEEEEKNKKKAREKAIIEANLQNIDATNATVRKTVGKLWYNYLPAADRNIHNPKVYTALLSPLVDTYKTVVSRRYELQLGFPYKVIESVIQGGESPMLSIPFSGIQTLDGQWINDEDLIRSWSNKSASWIATYSIDHSKIKSRNLSKSMRGSNNRNNNSNRLAIYQNKAHWITVPIGADEKIFDVVFDEAKRVCIYSVESAEKKKNKVMLLRLDNKANEPRDITPLGNGSLFFLENVNGEIVGISGKGISYSWHAPEYSAKRNANFGKQGLDVSKTTSNGKDVFVGCEDGLLYKKTASGKDELLFENERFSITALACSPDGKWLASGYKNGSLILFNLEPDIITPTYIFGRGSYPNTGEITSLLFSKNDMVSVATSNGAFYEMPILMRVLAEKICSDGDYITDPIQWKKLLKNNIPFETLCEQKK